MRHFTRENTDRFCVEVHGGGIGVEVTDKIQGITAFLQGDDASDFLAEMDKMEAAHADEASVWHRATWNDCLAQLSDEILAAANPDYSEWREAALAQGWKVVDRDPSEDRGSEGPCLLHEQMDRAMPLGQWEDAVRDLGFANPAEALEDARGADTPSL